MKSSYADQDNVVACFYAATKGKTMKPTLRRKTPIHRRLLHFATDYFYYRSRGYSRRQSLEMASKTI